MSDTILAAIIGALSAVIAAVIGVVYKGKKNAKKNYRQETLSRIGSINNSVINVSSRQTEEPQVDGIIQLNLKSELPISDLSHKEICDVIESAPPFHHDMILNSFIGKRISWETRLSRIAHLKHETIISADIPEGSGTLLCHAAPKDCEVFMTATDRTRFVVTGKITDVSRYTASLENCTFKIL